MRIITHNGPFHADDVIGCANATYFLSLGADSTEQFPVLRTRDKAILEEGLKDPFTVMVDVGGEYSPELLNFDHHFVGAPLRESGEPYASAGLTALAFLVNDKLEELCRKVDLADNGLHNNGWSLSMTVNKCNPLSGNPGEFDTRFEYLAKLALEEIVKGIAVYGYSPEFAVGKFESDAQVVEWVEEYEAALTASEARVKQAFLQESSFVTLLQYEPALMELAHLAPERKFYSIFPNPGGEWMVQQVPISYKSPKGRKPLPEEWAGKRGADLDAITGIEGCVFCHPARFIGGHKTIDGAIKMAELALSL